MKKHFILLYIICNIFCLSTLIGQETPVLAQKRCTVQERCGKNCSGGCIKDLETGRCYCFCKCNKLLLGDLDKKIELNDKIAIDINAQNLYEFSWILSVISQRQIVFEQQAVDVNKPIEFFKEEIEFRNLLEKYNLYTIEDLQTSRKNDNILNFIYGFAASVFIFCLIYFFVIKKK